jgi:hydroxypyruvate reductase
MSAPGSTTPVLQRHARGATVQRVLVAALRAVDPYQALRRHVIRQGDSLSIGGQSYDLDEYEHVYLAAIGKAGAPMARLVIDLLADRLTQGIALVKDGYQADLPGVAVLAAGHPVPDERGVLAAGRIMQMLSNAGERDLVLCLISGGGSALLTSPASGLTLEDLQSLTTLLLRCGASINEINTLRKHLEVAKGGNLAKLAHPARIVTLVLSDVIGDPLDVIASGPTFPDPTTYQDAYAVLERYNLLAETPPAILKRLEGGCRGALPETPKPGDLIFAGVQYEIIGNNYQAAKAALEQAQQEGLNPLLLTTCLQGEAQQAGRFLAAIARQVALSGQPVSRPACIVAGGETTVTLLGDGLGGRNQEVALGAVSDLAGLENALLVSLATDGGDGPTDAAGAVASGETLQQARALGMHPQDYLRRNDSYHFFERLGGLIVTGPTLTNVNDLSILFLF